MLRRIQRYHQKRKTVSHFQRAENRARAIEKAQSDYKRAKELEKESKLKAKTAKIHAGIRKREGPSGLEGGLMKIGSGLGKIGDWAESRQFASGKGPFPSGGSRTRPTRRQGKKKKKSQRREPDPWVIDLDF